MNLIFDRTKEDVDRVYELKNKILTYGLSSLTNTEKMEYMSGMKGAYNHTDLNRVGNACLEVRTKVSSKVSELETYRIAKDVYPTEYSSVDIDVTSTINPKTNWTYTDIPTQEQMSNYLTCVSKVTIGNDIPNSMDELDYEGANKIEKALNDTYNDIDLIVAEKKSNIDTINAIFDYAGEIYAGER